jgi:hypothetical protein
MAHKHAARQIPIFVLNSRLAVFRFFKNSNPVLRCLQLEDLRRHAKWEVHHKAFAAKLQVDIVAASQSSHEAAAASQTLGACAGTNANTTPTVAQFRLSLEVVNAPLGAQAAEYERKAFLANRSDPRNFPLAHCHRYDHMRIIECFSKALYEQDRKMIDKGNVRSAGWAQDRIASARGASK